MKIPETREELFDEFSRYGYRGVIERCGLLNLLQHHTIDAIVWTAWHADEVAERTVYHRKRQLRNLLRLASGAAKESGGIAAFP